MKTLIVVRHAKSSWDEPGIPDLDRPLSKRGVRDAPFMAKVLHGIGFQADKLVSSPAKRALDTATFFAKEWKIPTASIAVDRGIYEAPPQRLLEIVRSLSDEWQTVFLFGHNPALTSFINLFAREYLANLPTCGIAHLESNIAAWSEWKEANARMEKLFFPKQYFTN